MSSLFTDTIRKTGGTLGTDIRIKNTSVYESDGGTSVTQNLVQGLIKVWVNFQGDASSISPRDSLNVGSLTDNGTGNYTVTYSNNMSNSGYCVVATSRDGGGYNDVMNVNSCTDSTFSSSQVELFCTNTNSDGSGNANDTNAPLWAVAHGDLA